jgi:hypothetical protein
MGHWHPTVFRMVNLDEEANIPSFYSSLILLFSSILLFVITFYRKIEKNRNYKYWLGLALIFLFLSFDENASIHELIIKVYWKFFEPSDFDNYVWLIPYGVLVFLLMLAYWKFIFSLPRKTYSLFILSGILYVLGALGMEVAGSMYVGVSWYQPIDWGHRADYTYYLISTVEESLEMFGVVTFIYALLSYIETNWQGIYLCVGNALSKNEK